MPPTPGFLKALLLPPASLLVIAGIGWLLYRRRPVLGRWVVGSAIVLIYALSTPLMGNALMVSLETSPAISLNEDLKDIGAIVILSAGLQIDAPEYGGDTVGSLTLERLRYGARVHSATGIPVLVTGGEIPEGNIALAQAMEKAMREDFKVAVRWVESESKNTYENAVATAAILGDQGIKRIALVTHAWHMPRSLAAFESLGLEVVAAPTMFTRRRSMRPSDLIPSAKGPQRSAFATHEWIGRLWYWLGRQTFAAGTAEYSLINSSYARSMRDSA